MRRGTPTLAAGAALAASLVFGCLAAPPASLGAVERIVHADNRIATYSVKADGTLRGAVEAFGRPSAKKRNGEVCRVRWSRLGMRIVFYNLGRLNPCRGRYGYFSRAIIRGDGWHTVRGLAIGNRLARLQRLYPSAGFHRSKFLGDGWWLVRRHNPFGLGGHYPGLMAVVSDRRVQRFVVRYPAGGD